MKSRITGSTDDLQSQRSWWRGHVVYLTGVWATHLSNRRPKLSEKSQKQPNCKIVVYNVGCLYVFAGKQWWEAKTANNSVLLSSCHHCRCNLASVVAGIMLSFMLSRYHLSLQFRKFNYSSAYSTDLISPWRQWHDWLLRYHSPLWLVSGDDAISGGDPVPLPVKVKVDLYSASSWEPHL